MPVVYHNYSQTVADGTATSVVRPSDWNSVHPQTYTVLGNTTGNSTGSGTNIFYSASNHLTLQADNNTITVWGPERINFVMPNEVLPNSVYSGFAVGNSHHFQPFKVFLYGEFNNLAVPMSFNRTTSTNQLSATHSLSIGLFIRELTNTSLWSRIASRQLIISASFNSSTACGLTISYDTTSFTSTSNTPVGVLAPFSGARIFDLPFQTTLSAGREYALAMRYSSAGSSAALAAFSFLHNTFINNTTFGKIFATDLNNATGSGTIFNENEQFIMTSTTFASTWQFNNGTVNASRARQVFCFESTY